MSEPSPNLGRRFLVSGLQLGSANWLTYAVNFAIQIALARILGPESFGLYAFVLAINEFVNIIGAFSFGLALIQDREESQSRYDTALILYALIALGGLVISAGVAVFLLDLRGPTAAWFLLVMAGSRFFLLFAQVPQARLERSHEVDVRRAALGGDRSIERQGRADAIAVGLGVGGEHDAAGGLDPPGQLGNRRVGDVLAHGQTGDGRPLEATCSRSRRI